MNAITHPASTEFVAIAERTGFAIDAVQAMSRSIVQGGGRMAQFDHAAFGGPGQWMRGGMLMISDPFDHVLKQRVAQLCEALATQLANEGGVDPVVGRPSQSQWQGAGDSEALATRETSAPWYPAGLGVPSSSGAQNRTRYAWFAGTRRLAVDDGARVTVYDTGDHVIGGVSQQQGSHGTVAFTSQHGNVDVARLRVVDGSLPAEAAAAPVPMDPFQALERLAALHARGIVSDDEFAAKRIELLERI